MRIALATSEDLPNLALDDQALLQPLADLGIQAEPAVWSDTRYNWVSRDLVIIRSCWDYHLRTVEFFRWIESLEARAVQVCNRPATLRWNADKAYLRELEDKGIPTVPTLWFEPGPSISLADEIRKAGWERAVIKPRISATAHRTKLILHDEAEDFQGLFDDLRSAPGVMLQEFVSSIATLGEWSLMFFGGEFSHAILKMPKAGDFRVQHDFGGTERGALPPEYVLDVATSALRALNTVPLYARVDGIEHRGQFLLMELELIEPALFLRSSPGAASRFAHAIARTITS